MTTTLLLLLACASRDPAPAPAAMPPAQASTKPAPQSPPQDAEVPVTTTPPFTAAQIREGMPVDAHIVMRLTTPEGVMLNDWLVLEADAEGCLIRYTTLDAGGAVLEAAERPSLWTELEDHARFPSGGAEFAEESVTTALGEQDAVVVTLHPSEAEVKTFVFAKDKPGAPVLVTHTVDGAELMRMEMVTRELPEG